MDDPINLIKYIYTNAHFSEKKTEPHIDEQIFLGDHVGSAGSLCIKKVASVHSHSINLGWMCWMLWNAIYVMWDLVVNYASTWEG